MYVRGNWLDHITARHSISVLEYFVSLIDRPAPVVSRSPLNQISVVLWLKEDSAKCIWRGMGIDHVWSVWLQMGQHWMFYLLGFQRV